MSRIRDRLAGRHILITGSTGFLAKVFVEKLLRDVETVGGLHLLVRPRSDGRPADQRVFKEVLGSSAFDRLRAMLGDAFEDLCREKIHIISGDLTRERLGLSEKAYEGLCGRIDLVVNSAATVTFDERLDLALELNVQGPGRLLQLARDAGPVPMMQVSTCYVCGVRRGDVAEDFSAPEPAREKFPRVGTTGEFDVDAILAQLGGLCETVRAKYPDENERCRQELIQVGMTFAREHGWNDTYTLTKWLGEQCLRRDQGTTPLAIFRPAIIEGSWSEPSPGWIDGMRMADPLIVAYGRGKLREFPANVDVALDLIPVDFVANAMVATLATLASAPAADSGAHNGSAPPAPVAPENTPVYHCASSGRRPLFIRDLVRHLKEGFRRRPLTDEQSRPIQLPGLKGVNAQRFNAKWRRRATRVDRIKKLLSALGMKNLFSRPLATARRQIEQILYFGKIYAPYTHLDVRFRDDALMALHQSLHPEDQERFGFDAEKIDWREYLVNRHIPGLRHFVLGTGAEPSARLVEAGRGPLTDPRAGRSILGETLYEVFEKSARAFPDKAALQIQRDKKWVRYTYAEALMATGAIVRRLQEKGLKLGDRVAINAENGPEWGLVYLAIMRAGMTAVPIDPALPAKDVWAMARFARCRLVCGGRATHARLSEFRTDEDAPLALLAAPFVPPPGACHDEGPAPEESSGSDLASILFTSGTTVAPKAVMLTHRNFLANARGMLDRHPLRPNDEFLSVLPLYHAFEFTCGFLTPLFCGSTVTYVEQLKAPELLAAMTATGTTLMLVVPRLLQLFHDAIQDGVSRLGPTRRMLFRGLERISSATGGRYGRRLFPAIHRRFGGRLRMLVSGGSRLDPLLFEAFRRWGFVVCEGYGLTETAPVLTVCSVEGARAASVGTPLPNVELEVRNQNLETIGEIWVRGPNVTPGYLYNEAATRELIEDGWLRTGDLGRLDAAGRLYLTGRAKDLIVTASGKNVYPDEVEAKYRDLPYVKEMCVVAMPCEKTLGEAVHAVVVPDRARHPELDPSFIQREIRQAAADIGEGLPSHERLARIHFWERELPKTSTLKPRRQHIREMLLSRGSAPSEPEEERPRDEGSAPARTDEAAAQVLTILERISQRPARLIHEHSHLLLDLGIDSIARLEVVSEIEGAFRLRITDEQVSELARVGDLLELIGSKKPTAAARQSRNRVARKILGNGEAAAANGKLPAPLLPLRWMIRGGTAALLHSYIRVIPRGRENIPARSAFILAANHSSHLDSPAIVTAVGGLRRIWIAAAQDYFFDTMLKRFLFGKVFDTIPFDRHADGIQGLQRCSIALQRGDGLLIYPEGTRSLTGEINRFKIGAAVLAAEAGVPLVPVHVANAWELMKKGDRFARPGIITITFGEPILPPPEEERARLRFEVYRDMTHRLEETVRALGFDGRSS